MRGGECPYFPRSKGFSWCDRWPHISEAENCARRVVSMHLHSTHGGKEGEISDDPSTNLGSQLQ